MNDRIITFLTMPFPQGKSRVWGPYRWGLAEKSKDAKDLSQATEEEDWHLQVWATWGGQRLAGPTPPGSNEGLAGILGSSWWERQAEANCPRLASSGGRSWRKERELGERASGPQYGAEQMVDLGEFRPIREWSFHTQPSGGTHKGTEPIIGKLP